MDRNSGTSTPFSRLASSWTAPNVLGTVYVRIQLQCRNMWIGMKTNAQQYLLRFPSQHTLATETVPGNSHTITSMYTESKDGEVLHHARMLKLTDEAMGM